MFDDTAKTTGNEEHLYVALVQTVHELPGQKRNAFVNNMENGRKK